MIRLTDKEIQVIIQDALASEDRELGDYIWQVTDEDRGIVKAQVKKFAEWLKGEVLEDCHEGYSNVMCFHRRALKALLEE